MPVTRNKIGTVRLLQALSGINRRMQFFDIGSIIGIHHTMDGAKNYWYNLFVRATFEVKFDGWDFGFGLLCSRI